VQLAATYRDVGHAPLMYEVVENAGDAGDRWRELKILVSPVQSRPCPPDFQPLDDRPFRAVTELSLHPVMNMNRTTSARSAERWRQIDSTCWASANP